MYKWKIDFSLKSGQNISGLYEGEEDNSFDIGESFLIGDAEIFVLSSMDKTAQLFVMKSEVAAIGISLFTECIDNRENM